jgi:hypothetical protein
MSILHSFQIGLVATPFNDKASDLIRQQVQK